MRKLIINILFILFCIIFVNNGYAKASCKQIERDSLYVVHLKEYFDGKGVVFSKKDIYYGTNIGHQRITPTLTDIKETEQILDNLINKYFIDDSLKKFDYKSKLRKYYNRQYFGFITKSNERIIEINLFNFEDPKAIKYFDGWDKSFYYSTDNFYSNNTKHFSINITTKKLIEGESCFER